MEKTKIERDTDGEARGAGHYFSCPAWGESHHHRCETCNVRMLSLCAALDIREIVEIEHLSRPQCYASGEAMMREGDPADNVYNVTGGMVRLSRLLPDGRRQIVAFALPGDFLGLDLEGSYGLTAEAVGPVNACRFQRRQFVDFVATKPDLMKRLHALTAHELTLAQDHIVILGRRNADGKLAAFLVSLRDRLTRVGGGGAHLPLAMSRQDIADHLGLTIETVSRTISKFAREKLLLVTPDGVRILNAAKLEQLASG